MGTYHVFLGAEKSGVLWKNEDFGGINDFHV